MTWALELRAMPNKQTGGLKALARWVLAGCLTVGAPVALLRAFKVRQAQRGHSGIAEADEDSGPMLDADADAFIHGGFD